MHGDMHGDADLPSASWFVSLLPEIYRTLSSEPVMPPLHLHRCISPLSANNTSSFNSRIIMLSPMMTLGMLSVSASLIPSSPHHLHHVLLSLLACLLACLLIGLTCLASLTIVESLPSTQSIHLLSAPCPNVFCLCAGGAS